MDSEGSPRSKRSGCLEEHEAIALLEGKDERTATRWRTHLSECESCQEYVAALAQVLLPPSEASVGGWGEGEGALSPGTRLGHYVTLSMIGRGGMGAVYEGRDARLDRAVAIKVLREEVGERRVAWTTKGNDGPWGVGVGDRTAVVATAHREHAAVGHKQG